MDFHQGSLPGRKAHSTNTYTTPAKEPRIIISGGNVVKIPTIKTNIGRRTNHSKCGDLLLSRSRRTLTASVIGKLTMLVIILIHGT